jgi:hypothetical protein
MEKIQFRFVHKEQSTTSEVDCMWKTIVAGFVTTLLMVGAQSVLPAKQMALVEGGPHPVSWVFTGMAVVLVCFVFRSLTMPPAACDAKKTAAELGRMRWHLAGGSHTQAGITKSLNVQGWQALSRPIYAGLDGGFLRLRSEGRVREEKTLELDSEHPDLQDILSIPYLRVIQLAYSDEPRKGTDGTRPSHYLRISRI